METSISTRVTDSARPESIHPSLPRSRKIDPSFMEKLGKEKAHTSPLLWFPAYSLGAASAAKAATSEA